MSVSKKEVSRCGEYLGAWDRCHRKLDHDGPHQDIHGRYWSPENYYGRDNTRESKADVAYSLTYENGKWVLRDAKGRFICEKEDPISFWQSVADEVGAKQAPSMVHWCPNGNTLRRYGSALCSMCMTQGAVDYVKEGELTNVT